MSLQEIQRMVRQGEGERIEFKRKVAHPDKIIREIVAFANTKGGHLLIGVDDNGTIPGIKFAEEDIYVLEKAIQQWCRPKIDYEIEIVPLSDKKSVVHYRISESERKPHYVLNESASLSKTSSSRNSRAPQKKSKGKAYVRSEDKSLQASREVWQILRRGRHGKDIKFTFGDREKQLMEYLEEHRRITVTQFAQLVGLSRYHASRTLILLVLGSVLRVIPQEKEDVFVLK